MSKLITITTTVKADIQKAWNSWTQPEHITQWNHASDDWHCPKAANDLRAGGTFSATMASRDGKMSFDFAGVYDEVVPQKKLAYHMGDGRKVAVAFEEKNGHTTITETFDAENQNPIEMQRAGWQAILDNYRKHTEALK